MNEKIILEKLTEFLEEKSPGIEDINPALIDKLSRKEVREELRKLGINPFMPPRLRQMVEKLVLTRKVDELTRIMRLNETEKEPPSRDQAIANLQSLGLDYQNGLKDFRRRFRLVSEKRTPWCFWSFLASSQAFWWPAVTCACICIIALQSVSLYKSDLVLKRITHLSETQAIIREQTNLLALKAAMSTFGRYEYSTTSPGGVSWAGTLDGVGKTDPAYRIGKVKDISRKLSIDSLYYFDNLPPGLSSGSYRVSYNRDYKTNRVPPTFAANSIEEYHP